MAQSNEIAVAEAENEKSKKYFFKSNDKHALLIIITIATLFTIPLLIHGLPNGDDAAMHYRRANDFIEALGEGQWYPRWLPNSNYKQGNPVMLFYPPLPYYVVATFNLFVRDPMLAVCLGCWFALLISGLAMYLFSRSILSPAYSLLAALIYVIAPYHLFDLYHRSALSEFWAFAWLPLVADAARRVAMGGGLRALVYLAGSYALFLLTHVTIAFEMTLFLPIYFLILTQDWRRILQAVAAATLGALMSAIFIVPLLMEIKYIRIDRALRISFTNFFLFEHLGRAFNTNVFPPPEGRRFYYLDGVNLTAFCLGVLFLISILIIWRNRERLAQHRINKNLIIATSVITALSLLLTTRITTILWKNISQFAYIQFPFRWLTITILTVALLAGIAASLIPKESRFRLVLGTIFSLVVIFTCAVSVLLVVRATYNRQELDDGLSALEVAEYRTVFLDRQKRLDEFEKPAVLGIDGEATVQPLDDFGYQQSYTISAGTPSTIKLRPLYFPGWVARLEGNPIAVEPSKEGNLQLTVEPGEHNLTLRFEDTKPRTAGKYLSLVGWCVFFGLILFTRRKPA